MSRHLFKLSKCCLMLLGVSVITGCSEEKIKHNYENMIYVNQSSLELFCGETQQLIASPTENTFNWSSEDPEIATVDANGKIMAVGEGYTRIVVTSGEYTKYVDVEVEIPTATSIIGRSGNKRAVIELNIENEYVEKILVECTTNNTSKEEAIEGRSGIVHISFDDLNEQAYDFTVTCIDKLGNEAAPVSFTTNVYGDNFQATVKNRVAEVTTRFGNGLAIRWKDIEGDCTLEYKNELGESITKEISVEETNTYLYDYGSDLTYTTYALPELNAIDAFQAGPNSLEESSIEDLRSVLTMAGPCVINVFNFDLGGEGVGYHDESAHNEAGNNYRSDKGDANSQGVDLEGGNIGYTTHGEWLMFTLDVQEAGTYAFDLHRSVNNEGRNGYYSLEIDGVKTDYVLMPDDNNWGAYKWQHETYPESQPKIQFTVGKHTVKFILGKDGDHGKVNFKEIRFSPVNE